MIKYNGHSETGEMQSVLMKSPARAWFGQDYTNHQWEKLHYPGKPSFEKALQEFNHLASIVEKNVPEVYYMPENDQASLDSVYTHDPFVMTDNGAILCNMSKRERENEPAIVGAYLENLGIPVIGSIKAPGRLEGGDVVWFDDQTVAVGLGYRTNKEGINQFKTLTANLVEDLLEVPLPHWNGPEECLHLTSMISPVDENLAVVYSRIMPVSFRNYLLEKGLKLIEVSDREYSNFASNILALAPRKVIMIGGSTHTRAALEKEGVIVHEYPGGDITLKGGGGPNCLTRALYRK